MRTTRTGVEVKLNPTRRFLTIAIAAAAMFMSHASTAKVPSAAKPWLEAYDFAKRASKEWQKFDDHFTYAIDVTTGAKKPRRPKVPIKTIELLHAQIVSATEAMKNFPLPEAARLPDVPSSHADEQAWSQSMSNLVVWVERQRAAKKDRDQLISQLSQLAANAQTTAEAGAELERLLGDLGPFDPTKRLQAAWLDMIFDINPAVGDFRLELDRKSRSLAALAKQEDTYLLNSEGNVLGFLTADSKRLTQSLNSITTEIEELRNELTQGRADLLAARREVSALQAEMNRDLRDLRADDRRARNELKRAQDSIRNHDEDVREARRIRNSVENYRCVEGNKWEDCNNHPEEKAAWKRKMQERSDNRLDEIEREFRWAKRNIAALRQEVVDIAASIKEKQEPHLAAIGEAKADVNEIASSQAELTADLRSQIAQQTSVKKLLTTNASNMQKLSAPK